MCHFGETYFLHLELRKRDTLHSTVSQAKVIFLVTAMRLLILFLFILQIFKCMVGIRLLASFLAWAWWGLLVRKKHCAHPPSIFCLSKKYPQWLKLWMYFWQGKCFEKNFILPGCSEVSLAVTMPCWLQLCRMIGSLASKLSGHYDSWPLRVDCVVWCQYNIPNYLDNLYAFLGNCFMIDCV